MQKPDCTSHNVDSLRVLPQQSLRRWGRCFQIANGQHSSPTVFPEKRGKIKSANQNVATSDNLEKVKTEEIKIDIGDEHCDLLGYEVLSGKLYLDKRTANTSANVQMTTETRKQDDVCAKLTSKALVWGSHTLCLEDVISVSFLHKINDMLNLKPTLIQ